MQIMFGLFLAVTGFLLVIDGTKKEFSRDGLITKASVIEAINKQSLERNTFLSNGEILKSASGETRFYEASVIEKMLKEIEKL